MRGRGWCGGGMYEGRGWCGGGCMRGGVGVVGDV